MKARLRTEMKVHKFTVGPLLLSLELGNAREGGICYVQGINQLRVEALKGLINQSRGRLVATTTFSSSHNHPPQNDSLTLHAHGRYQNVTEHKTSGHNI